jgi:hypothetical protein
MAKAKPESRSLKGWGKIAKFLGQTTAVAQRWQNEGMPVSREGRLVYASPEDLTAWVGTERGKKEPVHIATEGEDLVADLKEALSYVRKLRNEDIKELGISAPRDLRATDIRWRDTPSPKGYPSR